MRRLLLLLAIGCTKPSADNCTSATCANGRSYQQCVTPGSTQVEYLLGVEGCSCSVTSCNICSTLVANYCSAASGGTTGGTTNGGGTSGGTTGGDDNPAPGGGTTSGGSGGTTGAAPACRPGGSPCQSFGECCSGTCANQICTQCRDDGAACNLASECCSNICRFGACRACTVSGSSCTSSAECCNGLACTGGVCGGPDSSCTSLDKATCRNCCAATHADGLQRYEELADACACQPANCASECASSACAGLTSDQTCVSCFVTKCQSQTEAACLLDSACGAMAACLLSCPSS